MKRTDEVGKEPVKLVCREGGAVATAHAGAVLVLKLLSAKGFLPRPEAHERGQGWTDGQMMLAVMLLNYVGKDRVEDIEELEADAGLRELVRRYEERLFGVGPGWFARRFRGGRKRTFPSARSLHDWLARSHDEAAGRPRRKGVAYIPRPSAGLRLSGRADRGLLEELAAHREVDSVTLDLDATIVPSGKREARFTYRSATGEVRGERGYQPMVAYCPELGAVVHTEFRDGNVPASRDKRRFLEEALGRLPERVAAVRVRADTAGYQEDLIRFCNDPGARPAALRRFGVIGLIVGAPRQEELAAAVRSVGESAWRPAAWADGREVAEVPFSSNMTMRQEPSHVMRYVAVRRVLWNRLGLGENDLPASGGRPAMRFRVVFTNIPAPATAGERAAGRERSGSAAKAGPRAALPGEAVVESYYGRCG